MKIHIKCSEFGWVKNVTDGRTDGGGIPFYRVGITGIKNKKTPLGIGNGDEDQSVPISPEGTPDDAVGFAKKMKEQG